MTKEFNLKMTDGQGNVLHENVLSVPEGSTILLEVKNYHEVPINLLQKVYKGFKDGLESGGSVILYPDFVSVKVLNK